MHSVAVIVVVVAVLGGLYAIKGADISTGQIRASPAAHPCVNVEQTLAQAEELSAAGKHRDAIMKMGECYTPMNKDTYEVLKSKYEVREAQDALAVLPNEKWPERLASIRVLKAANNPSFLQHKAEHDRSERRAVAEAKARQAKLAADERKRLADRKAEKKRQGAAIGMTPEEVHDSMWGKPQSINRTITEHGASEQWVYGGGNYLYFRNGRLTAIQN